MVDELVLDHAYLPILGLSDFCEAAVEMLLGRDSIAILENRVKSYLCVHTMLCV